MLDGKIVGQTAVQARCDRASAREHPGVTVHFAQMSRPIAVEVALLAAKR
jgi:hypothetical protein